MTMLQPPVAGADLRSIGAGMSPWTRAAVGAGAVAGGAALVQLAGTDSGPELCVIRRWTGGYCPGCGAARACRHVLHGDLTSAWADHPWVVFAAAQIVLVAIVLVAGLLVGGRSLAAWRVGRRRRGPFLALLAVGNVVALGLVWVARLAGGDIPSPV